MQTGAEQFLRPLSMSLELMKLSNRLTPWPPRLQSPTLREAAADLLVRRGRQLLQPAEQGGPPFRLAVRRVLSPAVGTCGHTCQGIRPSRASTRRWIPILLILKAWQWRGMTVLLV